MRVIGIGLSAPRVRLWPIVWPMNYAAKLSPSNLCDYGVFKDSHAPINALHCIQSVLDEAQVLESLDMQSRSTSSWTIEMSRGFFCRTTNPVRQTIDSSRSITTSVLAIFTFVFSFVSSFL